MNRRFILIIIFMLITCVDNNSSNFSQEKKIESFNEKKEVVVEIYTEEDPPYSFTDENGELCGYGVDIVNEIQQRLGYNYKIQVVPWARAYNIINKRPNVVVFTMSRTRERENLFRWVGPIVKNDWVFVSKKNSKIKIKSLQDAKKIELIGAVRNYAWTEYLVKNGFTNIDIVNERKQNPLKLCAGRIDAFVSSDFSYKKAIELNGLNPDDFKILFRFKTIQMYIALSLNSDTKIVEAWSSAFNAMKKDGTLKKIYQKWFPQKEILF